MTGITRESSCESGRPSRLARRFSPLVPGSVAAVAMLFLLALPAAAELVIFDDGHFLHVESYRAEGDRARLELPSGGLMTLPLHRVERVVDDAPVRSEEPAPESTAFSLRFAEGHPVPDVPYGDLIHRAARRHGLNPELVAAVARAESAYRPDAVSSKGARGLMQLMPATAARFGLDERRIHDPERNLDVGTRYLRLLADRFGDELPLVLAAYNAGEGTVGRYGGVPPYRETRGYLARIYRFLGIEAGQAAAVAVSAR